MNTLRLSFLVVVLCITFCTVFPSCKTDHVVVNKGSSDSPQHAYRLDELALLRLIADDVFSSERNKQYAYIYKTLASKTFQEKKSLRRFLQEANCVETHLGEIDTFDPNENGFSRKQKNEETLDYLTRRVSRTQETLEEELVLESKGLQFKLRDLIWHSTNPNFLSCTLEKIEPEVIDDPTQQSTSTESLNVDSTHSSVEEPKTPVLSE